VGNVKLFTNKISTFFREVLPLNVMMGSTVAKKKTSYSRQHQHGRLSCPACNFERLIDTGQHTRSQTFIEGQDGYPDADYYQKCSSCKAEIGIRKIE
jgi:hypothetical protein